MGVWMSDNTANIVTYPTTSTISYTVPATHHRQHKGLITTNAAKVRRGWLGQVTVDQRIVWESEPQKDREVALELADERVALAFEELFADPEIDS
jgi:hypothetical protein